MKVKQIMSKKVAWMDPGLPLQRAARKMRDLDVGCLPVGKNDRLVGMITDRDIACRAVAKGWNPAKKKIGDVMSKGIVYCFDDQDVGAAARIMERKQIYRLPVLNRKKRMVGILSLHDLALHVSNQLTGEVVKAISKH